MNIVSASATVTVDNNNNNNNNRFHTKKTAILGT
jgi:hypothetical protein